MTTQVRFETGLKVKEGSLETGTARQGFLVNVTSNLAFTAVQAIVTLWFTPFLIGYLGIAAYGMVPLVNSLVISMAILATAQYSTVSRFLAIELEQGDRLGANKTFNTALFAIAAAFLALTPLILLISLNFPMMFNVPPGWEKDASWLFAIVAAGFFVTVIGNNFGVSSFIYSRFLLINTVNFVALLSRVGFVVILFSLVSRSSVVCRRGDPHRCVDFFVWFCVVVAQVHARIARSNHSL